MKTPSFVNTSRYFIFLFFLSIFSYQLNAQIRLVEVDPTNNTVIIQNFGSSMVPISDYWFCTLFDYNQLNSYTIENGALNLVAGATVKLSGVNLNTSDADLGLYSTNSFGSSTAMVDFMQWGDAGNGRESVANTANIWTTGDFLAGTGPFIYSGNGTQNGFSFWGTGTLSVNDEVFSSNISIYPNPAKDQLTIKNLQKVDLKDMAIFDLAGRLIRLNNNVSKTTINLKGLQSGLYTLRLTDADGRVTSKKLFKQ